MGEGSASAWRTSSWRRPVPSCLRTTTFFPLWTPAKTIAMTPADSDGRRECFCLENKFLEVFTTSFEYVGQSDFGLLVATLRVPPFLAPPTFFSTKAGFLSAAALGVVFLVNL